ncbi:MAG: ABC transporter substrate-binding protein [Burkholderiales bacterium]|nr:ABC transporter substrate-binding protein [Burkholderiales bacterium]
MESKALQKLAAPARLLCVLAVLLAPLAALAQKAPDALVRSVADEVLKIVQNDQALREGDNARMASLIEEKIVPHFDFERMTRLAVGRPWREATSVQRQSLIDQFRTLLVRSYSAAYTTYKHIVIDVKPLRMQPSEEDVQVRTEIRLPGGAPPVKVDYSMVRANADWKVYDVVVDGVSMVTTYRNTFAEEVRRGGVDGLIRTLDDMNTAKTPPPAAGVQKQ